jgi:hypothetical protein
MIMTAPVWFLMARVPLFSGSNGYHRALLIDVFARHFGEWWLYGISRTVTNTWASDGSDMFDIANQYLWQGVTGGIWPLILFVAVIVYCFIAIGQCVARAPNRPVAQRMIFWCLGAALFSQSVNFLSVSYWDQNIVNWYLLLAMISSGSVLNPNSSKWQELKKSPLVSRMRGRPEMEAEEWRVGV